MIPLIRSEPKTESTASHTAAAGTLDTAAAGHAAYLVVLVAGGEPVALAARDESRAEALADELGPLARAGSVEDAIAEAEHAANPGRGVHPAEAGVDVPPADVPAADPPAGDDSADDGTTGAAPAS